MAKSKYLVIVESPAKAKTIGKYLGKDYMIKASYGHVRDLPSYNLGVDIENDYTPKYSVIKDKAKLIKEFKSDAKKVDLIYLATDPDREGEAIAWHIQESIGADEAQVKRIVFNEITKTAVQQALDHARGIDVHLVDAQQARRVLDRLIGYKLSPMLARKIRKGLSAGRVQSVAVKILCDREKEILGFVPEEYWVLDALFKTAPKLKSKLVSQGKPDQKITVPNEKEATAIKSELESAKYAVHSIKKSTQSRHPQPPFITSTLQQEASRKLNWSAKKTMLIAQQLYEGIEIDGEPVGLITYMRTDSTRISDDAKRDVSNWIESKYGKNYLSSNARKYKKTKGAQDAHEAIRPTYVEQSPAELSSVLNSDRLKLYKLIWDRFIASQMTSAELERTQITIEAEGSKDRYYLRASGQVILFDGFMKIYLEGKDEDEESDDQPSTLPKLSEGDSLTLDELNCEQKFTQPLPRYTEATLVRELEEKGIGRPSTYAPTLSTIQERGYVEKQNKRLHPTELGILVNDKLEAFFAEIMDLSFTAQMETKLDAIMDGDHEWQKVIDEFYTPFSGMLDTAYEKMEKVNMDRPSDEVCEKCGQSMVIKAGRFGDFLACSNYPECKNTKSIVVDLGVNCPECKSPLVEKRSKRGKVFYGCSGFPKCKYASWDKPIDKPCSVCNATPTFVKVRRGKEDEYCAACAK